MSETMNFSLSFAAIGISIVFAALAIISAVVALMRRADDRWQAHEQAQKAAAVEREPTIDNTTIVLIAAAVATFVQGRHHIRRVRRLLPSDAKRGPWSTQGRAVLHGSHIMHKNR